MVASMPPSIFANFKNKIGKNQVIYSGSKSKTQKVGYGKPRIDRGFTGINYFNQKD
jgi:hypothetical protein